MRTPHAPLPRACALALLSLLTAAGLRTASAQPTAIGSPILGTQFGDRAGESVALSADGTTVAIGAPNHDFGATDAGRVTVYVNVNGAWQVLGNVIDGTSFDEYVGAAVDLSANGRRLVVGAPRWNRPNTGSARDHGRVRVYDYDALQDLWVQVGNDLEGVNSTEQFGGAVAIDDSGTRIVVAAKLAIGVGGQRQGYVAVYQLANGSWLEVARETGRTADDQFGASVDMNAAGTMFVVGAPIADNGPGGLATGEVAVFSEVIPGAWSLQGGYLVGDAADDEFGHAVAMSPDGSRIAVGAPFYDGLFARSNSGRVRVYQLTGQNYTVAGSPLDGAGFSDRFGIAVALSQDGTELVVGIQNDDVGGLDRGAARVYEEAGGTWTQTAVTSGNGNGREYGYAVALTPDASTLAVSEPTSRLSTTVAGRVDVYGLGAPLPVELTSFTASLSRSSRFAKTGPAAGPIVELAWTTATERDAAYFAVERSGDGEAWTTVAEVDAAGNTDARTAYAHNDLTPLPGESYYRLRQVDFDGVEAYSSAAVVYVGAGVQGLADVRVFPNPARDYVELLGLPADATAELRDLAGRRVGVAHVGAGRLDLVGVPTGVYVLALRSGSGVVAQRVVVE